jgi:hypothetical protein
MLCGRGRLTALPTGEQQSGAPDASSGDGMISLVFLLYQKRKGLPHLKKNKELEQSYTELTDHLAETTVANLNREIEGGNNNKAHNIVHDRLEREGEAISILLRSRQHRVYAGER